MASLKKKKTIGQQSITSFLASKSSSKPQSIKPQAQFSNNSPGSSVTRPVATVKPVQSDNQAHVPANYNGVIDLTATSPVLGSRKPSSSNSFDRNR